jgi:hypothetical protein
MRFEDLPVGTAFRFRGRRFVKLALSMTEDENRIGTIFLAETEVEQEPKTEHQQFEYVADDIGNRTSTQAGGDAKRKGVSSSVSS